MQANELSQLLQRLAGAVAHGKKTLAEAVAEMERQAGVLLSPETVDQAADQECSRFLAHPDDQPMVWWHLLFAAVGRADPAIRGQCLVEATIPYLYAAGASCLQLPDGLTFAEARRRGETAFTVAQENGLDFAGSEILHRLGILCLDPFTVGRSPANYANEDAGWRRRLEIVRGQFYASQDGAAMPPSAKAIDDSIDYLDRALAMRTGQPRGFTLKAQAMALMWRGYLGGPTDRPRIAALAVEAMPLLPPEYRQEMRMMAEHFGGVSQSTEGELDLSEVPVEALFEGTPPQIAINRVRIAAQDAAQTNPAKAFDLVLRVWPMVADDFAAERQILANTFARAALTLARELELACVAAEKKGWLARTIGRRPADRGDPAVLDAELLRRARAESWNPPFVAAVRLGIAVSTQSLDREAESLTLLAAILAMGESIPPAMHDIVALLQAHFLQAAGVNAYGANDFAEAVRRYSEATGAFATLGYADQALSTLHLAEDASRQGGARSNNTLIVGLAHVTPAVAKLGGGPLAVYLRAIWERAMANAFGIGDSGHKANLEALVLALQAAKGATFAIRMNRPGAWDWREDEDTVALLDEIADLRATQAEQPRSQVKLSDSVVLASFDSDVAVDEPGDLGRLRRLRQRLDLKLLRGTVGDGDLLEACFTAGMLQQRIGADTVLLTQYVGKTTDGRIALVTVLFTDEDAQAEIGIVSLPGAQISMEADGMQVQSGWFTLPVAELRDALLEDADDCIVGPKAQRELDGVLSGLLGGTLPQKLAAFRTAGKTHICVHAHEALHFVPMQLMGSQGRILADDWTLTTVPHFASLARNSRAYSSDDLAEVSAFGLNYPSGIPHGQPELKRAEAEAVTIAKVMKGKSYRGPSVTEENFIAALENSRRLSRGNGSGRAGVSSPLSQPGGVFGWNTPRLRTGGARPLACRPRHPQRL